MADRQECRCRVLILGHSFVTWLGDFLDEEAVELGGQMVAWCRIGGAMVATLRAELGRQNVASFCMLVFVEIGSNDCAESLEVLFFSSIWALMAYLRTNGTTQLIPGQVLLFQSKEFWGGPSMEQFRVRRSCGRHEQQDEGVDERMGGCGFMVPQRIT